VRKLTICLVMLMTIAAGVMVGCASHDVPRTILVPLRDDARWPDVKSMVLALRADERVTSCEPGTLERSSAGPEWWRETDFSVRRVPAAQARPW
jgi:hypothetical protein